MTDYSTSKTTWWIAYGSGEEIHSGQVYEGNIISTGQPNLETFDNRIDWETRLLELKQVPEIQDQENKLESTLDDKLYCDSIEHLLYEDKEFRHIANPFRRDS